jgi:predicted nucleotidyltransferase
MSNQEILNKIRTAILSQDTYAQAFLFGSRARNTNRLNSDWDILILVNNPVVSNEIEDQFRDVLYDIELESGQIISTLIYPKETWNNNMKGSPLFRTIQNEGILLA